MQLSVSTPEPQVDQGGAMPSVLGCVPPPAEVVAPRWLSKQEVNRGGGTDEEENQGRSLQEAVARQPQPGKQFSSSSRWSGAEFTPNPQFWFFLSRHPPPQPRLSPSLSASRLLCLGLRRTTHGGWQDLHRSSPQTFAHHQTLSSCTRRSSWAAFFPPRRYLSGEHRARLNVTSRSVEAVLNQHKLQRSHQHLLYEGD